MKQRTFVFLTIFLCSWSALSAASTATSTQLNHPSPNTALVSSVDAPDLLSINASCLVEYKKDAHGMLLAQGCCRVCKAGKACGNACINKHYNCHKGKGCACDD